MKKIILFLLICVAVIFTILFFKSNSNKENINIGFISGLSGKYSSLGNSVLSGFKLAFEEIDYKIDNKSINIITKDDGQNRIKAREAITQLLDKNIKIIVGNTTSSMTKVSINEVKDKDDVLLISATASSQEFAYKDDNFLRTQVSINTQKILKLANYLIHMKKDRMSIYFDSKNSSYVKGVIRNIQNSYEKKQAQIVSLLDISSGFKNILNDVKQNNPNVIFIIANALDTAKLAQYLRLNNIDSQLASAAWAKELKLITEGGKAVEGMLFSTGYDDNSNDKSYKNFIKNYESLYGHVPSVFAAQAYETAKILIEALKNNSSAKDIKKYILSKKSFKGLQGKIVFDKYGDVKRDYFIVTIKNGKYKKIEL